MTYSQLGLLRHVLENVKEGKLPGIASNDEKVDLDYLANYFDNLILEVEKEKGKTHFLAFRLNVEVNK